jgi:hypothetical protein
LATWATCALSSGPRSCSPNSHQAQAKEVMVLIGHSSCPPGSTTSVSQLPAALYRGLFPQKSVVTVLTLPSLANGIQVFDTKTRAKGISIATMASFAFNTMIGQVTSPGMANIGYKFYYLFIVRPRYALCSLSSAAPPI